MTLAISYLNKILLFLDIMLSANKQLFRTNRIFDTTLKVLLTLAVVGYDLYIKYKPVQGLKNATRSRSFCSIYFEEY